jgi:acyl dehydratase
MSEQAAVHERLKGQIGQEIHVSEWLEITQQRVNAFAEATGDPQWIHVDVDRATRESPWGSTIAHGYLTLALYPMLRGLVRTDRPIYPGVRNVINYGLNKLRYPAAVRVGRRVRARCTLVAVEEVAGGLQFTENYTLEIDGEAKPGCVAEVIMRLQF